LKSFYSIAPVNAFARLMDSVSISDRPSRVQRAEIRFKSRVVTHVSNRRPAAANQSYIIVMKTMSARPAPKLLSEMADRPMRPRRISKPGRLLFDRARFKEVAMKKNQVEEFAIHVPDQVLSDLQQRLKNTRWSPQIEGTGWDAGTAADYLKDLIRYWQTEYDWRKHETALNQFAHFRTAVDDIGIHFIHEHGKGPNPFPLILTHGYPDSFYRFVKLIPLLADPEAYGGRAEDAFDVIVPDLPGFGFSDKPTKHGMIFRVHDLWARLMTERLGYRRFGAHGGDWGSTVTEQLARSHPQSVAAIHLTDVPFGHVLQKKPDDASPAEKKYFEHTEKWLPKEGSYATIQSTKPQNLSPGLNDSPAGLASWIVEKFRAWSDCGGDIESRFSKDELLTHLMIYWATESIGTSFLPYYDYANAGALTWMQEGVKNWVGSSKVPAAFAIFPKDISRPPREWAQRFFNVQRWTEMPRGGHFAAFEEPYKLAEDIRSWFRQFREENDSPQESSEAIMLMQSDPA
jgi:pimeloyl-ACP methyl ester carboxylesterase